MMRTSLYNEHIRLGARMTDFAGWEMPLYYSGVAEETLAVRTAVGLFDLSHMGEIRLSGPGALSSLQYLTTNNAAGLAVGQAQYTLLCNESGGVIDDLIVYRTEEESYLMVVNASNAQSDLLWIEGHTLPDTVVRDESSETSILAVQGPASPDILSPLAVPDVRSLQRFHVISTSVAGVRCLAARTGYTGEDGFELLCKPDDAPTLWTALMGAGGESGMRPVGLGARDVLRLEAAYPLYGHELNSDTTPVEARLMWVVDLDKGEFIGRDALRTARQTGAKRILAGLEAEERCVPRQGYSVLADGEEVGAVTSGTFSPTLDRPIALAYLDAGRAVPGTEAGISIRGKPCRSRVVRTPFYKPGTLQTGAPSLRRAHGVS